MFATVAIDGPPGSHYNNVGSQSNSLSTVGIEGEAMMLRVTVFLLSLANVPIGQLPPDWLAARTGEGPGSVWKVVEDATAPRPQGPWRRRQPPAPNRLFNLCVANRTSFRGPRSQRGLSAHRRQARPGRPRYVWRYIDAKNYYVARINPLEETTASTRSWRANARNWPPPH